MCFLKYVIVHFPKKKLYTFYIFIWKHNDHPWKKWNGNTSCIIVIVNKLCCDSYMPMIFTKYNSIKQNANKKIVRWKRKVRVEGGKCGKKCEMRIQKINPHFAFRISNLATEIRILIKGEKANRIFKKGESSLIELKNK